MTISISDISTISLTGTIPTGSTLDIFHGSNSFSGNGNNLYNELISLTVSDVNVVDFVLGGDTHEVYAWQVLADGSLTQWSRGSGMSYSGRHRALDASVLIIAVPPGISVPNPSSANGPPAPGTSQRVVRIKIHKQGDMPLR